MFDPGALEAAAAAAGLTIPWRLRGDDLVARAERFARKAHAGQTTPGGGDYADRSAAVAGVLRARAQDPAVVAAGWLHGVLADTSTTVEDLRSAGFPEDTVRVVVAVSPVRGEPTRVFFDRVAGTPGARAVVIAVTEHRLAEADQLPEGARAQVAVWAHGVLRELGVFE